MLGRDIILLAALATGPMACKTGAGEAAAESGLASTTAAAGATTTVECQGTYDNKVQKVRMKLSDRGKIVRWSKASYVSADKDSMFANFVEFSVDDEKVGDPSIASIKARNGYAMIIMISTADEIKVGVNMTDLKGFYQYHDIGSGAGNFDFPMTCAKV